ncbi:hypothetical protein VN0664_07010 [Helicobacter pylori]|nr:hypothetical protein VN0664_07010 [Helicobacter pylori]
MQSLELAKRLKGEVTIENYRGVSGLNHNSKQKKVFCKAMILSKSEQEKIDKIRAELGLIKNSKTKLNKTNRIELINQGIIALSLVGATGLFYCYGFNKEIITFVLLYLIPIVALACFSIREAYKIRTADGENGENGENEIKFELSARQHKYREALEN